MADQRRQNEDSYYVGCQFEHREYGRWRIIEERRHGDRWVIQRSDADRPWDTRRTVVGDDFLAGLKRVDDA
jgi:hypothetical protein